MQYGGVDNSGPQSKKKRGRENDEKRPFNRETEGAALTHLQTVFQNICGVDSDSFGFDPNPQSWNLTREELWVSGEQRLGVRGIILAMQLLWRQKGGSVINTREFKKTLAEDDKADIAALKVNKAISLEGDCSKLIDICVTPSSRLTRYDRKAVEANIIIGFARRTYAYVMEELPDENTLKAHCMELLALRLKSPAEIYKFFRDKKFPSDRDYAFEEVKTQPIDRSRGAHYIDQRFARYLAPHGEMRGQANSVKVEKLAKKIVGKLKTKKALVMPVLLCGPVNAGKSGVVVEMLRQLEQESADHPTIGLIPNVANERAQDGDQVAALSPEPVVVLNVRRYSQKEVAKLTLDALGNACAQPHHRRLQKLIDIDTKQWSGHSTEPSISQLHSLIEQKLLSYKEAQKRKGAALVFVFTNWDEWGANTPRGLLRDIPNASLVLMLQRHGCRVLISTIGDLGSKSLQIFASQFSKTKPEFQFRLEQPERSQINQYWRNGVPLPHERNAISQLPADRSFPGAHLILIAAAIQYCKTSGDGIQTKISKALLTAIADYTNALSTVHSSYVVPDALVAPIFDVFLNALDVKGALDAFLAIAVSDDGLRPHSLNQICTPWVDGPGVEDPELTVAVEELNLLAAGFFVPLVAPALAITEQFTAYEAGAYDGPGDQGHSDAMADKARKEAAWQPQYELNHTLRETLIALINDGTEPPLVAYRPRLRAAFRNIAAISRRRSRNWRLQEPLSCLTRDYRYMLPDIQCYEAILASIDRESLDDKLKCEQALAEVLPFEVRCGQIFELGSSCSDVHLLRYAVLDLLIGELDGKQHNLTMRYDIDGLRTRLYLGIFTSVGGREFRAIRNLTIDDLPKHIPAYAYNVFSVEELLEILEAIALSAFHHQCPAIVKWCSEREREIIKRAPKDKQSGIYAHSSRILCCSADMSLLLGHDFNDVSERGQPGLLEVYASRLESEIQARYETIDTWFENGAFLPMPNFDMEQQRSWLRIKARWVELLDRNGKRDEAVKMYIQLWNMDAQLAYKAKKFSGRGVLSGRPGRVMATILAESTVSECDPKKLPEVKAIIQRVLDGEIGRLSSYGGAERIAIAIARSEVRWILNGTLDHSIFNTAIQMRMAVDEERVSLRTRLLALDFYLRCAVGNSAFIKKHLSRLTRDTRLYFSMADALGFEPQKNLAVSILRLLEDEKR